MDKFLFNEFKTKVNMGNKKDLDKKALLAKNNEERLKRQLIKQQNEAA